MAPEILRYEKYDARVDLWSIGTVLYEMLVGRPPFKASNHVELLRKIEKGEDKIAFPSEIHVSDSLKRLVRGLLKRNPGERMSFIDFFNHTVIKDEIPGLTNADRALQLPRHELGLDASSGKEHIAEKTTPKSPRPEPTRLSSESARRQASKDGQPSIPRSHEDREHRLSGTPPRSIPGDARERKTFETTNEATRPATGTARRPSMITRATAPAQQELYAQRTMNAATAAMERKSSRTSLSSQEKALQRERAVQIRDQRERAAQDVAFERDYVVVEKRAVEVNAFADELAASPTIHGGSQDPGRGALVRRATQQGPPASTTGAQATPSRAMQVASGKRLDAGHNRKSSYERRLHDTTSATSAISKAINKASGRLFGIGFSPPLSLGRGGPSPPSYAPFPAYPTDQGSLLMLDDGSQKARVPLDEDTKTVQVIEESAIRSDAVYGFAQVKLKQLMPLAPSVDQGLGLQIAENTESPESTGDDGGLTADAVVTLSEEALVLYVKALAILAKAMDIAGAWWGRKNRGEIIDVSSSPAHPKSATNTNVAARVNNVVQWVRERFNVTLEKAELVRLKLLDAQKDLPIAHPSHPNNHPSPQSSISSADQIVVTSGLTAEKLMYDRALEMSRSAAVNELVGEDLPGCKLAYETAIRMLEAVLEDDDVASSSKASMGEKENRKGVPTDPVNGVEAEDRAVVVNSMANFSYWLQERATNHANSGSKYSGSPLCPAEEDAGHGKAK